MNTKLAYAVGAKLAKLRVAKPRARAEGPLVFGLGRDIPAPARTQARAETPSSAITHERPMVMPVTITG